MNTTGTIPTSPTRARLDQDNEALYEALDRLVRAYQFRDRQRACHEGLSVNECYALQSVLRHDGMSQNELAAELLLDKSTTSRLVAGMVERGHITRVADPEDGRVQRLRATAAGRRLHAKVRRGLLRRQRDVIEDLPDVSRRAVVLVLRRLAARAPGQS